MVCKRLTTLPIIGSSVNLITMTREEHKLPNKDYDMHARRIDSYQSVILISEVHEKQVPSSVHHHHHTPTP